MADRDDLLNEPSVDEETDLKVGAAEAAPDGTSSEFSSATDFSAADMAGPDGRLPDDTVSVDAAVPEPDTVPEKKDGRKFWHVLKRVLSFILSMLNPKNLFSGRIISIDFILRKWKTLLVVFILLMFYISNRYSCQQKVIRVGALRNEVEELGYRSLDMFVRLKKLQREEAVVKVVRDSALDLQYPDIPPYIILDKDHGSE